MPSAAQRGQAHGDSTRPVWRRVFFAFRGGRGAVGGHCHVRRELRAERKWLACATFNTVREGAFLVGARHSLYPEQALDITLQAGALPLQSIPPVHLAVKRLVPARHLQHVGPNVSAHIMRWLPKHTHGPRSRRHHGQIFRRVRGFVLFKLPVVDGLQEGCGVVQYREIQLRVLCVVLAVEVYNQIRLQLGAHTQELDGSPVTHRLISDQRSCF
mmetsp:Transcript_4313/g.10228  ORF Transcript_4313/g.10228 Transcript_4313/m.10228 type:complete len:214 (-) Transcript_4313:1133-1774(-)